MRHRIGFIRFAGSQVAYAVMGEGPVLVFPPPSFGHLDIELENEPMRSFFEALASRFTLVRYDRPGTGLSDRARSPSTFTLEFELDVLETLVGELTSERLSLFGFSYGGAVAAGLAARRPERVRRLMLFGAYTDGARVASPALLRSVTGVLRADWELGSRLLAEAFAPEGDEEQTNFFVRLRRESCTGEMAASLLEMWSRTDLRDLLGHITAPTMVVHRVDDAVVPAALGRALAALIPGARLELLAGRWHQPWLGHTANVLRVAGEFFGFDPPRSMDQRRGDNVVALTPREREVLRLVAQGLSDANIAEQLVLSSHTVHRHVANIRARLGQPSRAAAAAHAARNGLI